MSYFWKVAQLVRQKVARLLFIAIINHWGQQSFTTLQFSKTRIFIWGRLFKEERKSKGNLCNKSSIKSFPSFWTIVCLVTPHFLFSYVPLLGQQYLLPIVHRTTCYLAKVFISEWPEIYCKEQGIHVKLLCGFVNHSGGHPLESLSGCMKTIHRIVLKRNQLQ